MSRILIPFLSNSQSRSLSCTSKTFTPSRIPPPQSSTIMSIPLMISNHPTLIIIGSILCQTRALIVRLHLTKFRLVISAPAVILNVCVDSGATLLKTVNRWQCISLFRIICRKMPILNPLARSRNAGASPTNITCGLPVPPFVPSGLCCPKICLVAPMMKSWISCKMKMMHFRIFSQPVFCGDRK
jgi:hypothetical protein